MQFNAKDNCSHCVFALLNLPKSQIMCRRYPPELRNIQRQNPLTQQIEVALVSFQPEVPADMWCGEFKYTGKPTTVELGGKPSTLIPIKS